MRLVIIQQNWTSFFGICGYFVSTLETTAKNGGYFLPVLSLCGEIVGSLPPKFWLFNMLIQIVAL